VWIDCRSSSPSDPLATDDARGERPIRARDAHRAAGLGVARAAGLGVVALALALACGRQTELPVETGGGIIPASGTYIVKQIWPGFAGAGDILLTSGSQVYVSFPDEGRVLGYFSTGTTPKPNGKVMEGTAPAYLAEGVGRTLVVSDRDTAGPVVRVYDQATAELMVTFRDTAWVEIAGVAADADSFIYVSDKQTNRVSKYDARGVFRFDLADEGDGAGYVRAPTLLSWHPGEVLVVDSGKQWLQALDPDASNRARFFLTGSGSPIEEFQDLRDVDGDDDGNLYVADAAHQTVLKYDEHAEFDQRVELNAPEGVAGHLLEPDRVTANRRLVYVLDRADGEIVTFELDE